MRLGIVLGREKTCLSCWQNNTLVDNCKEVSIPDLLSYVSNNEGLFLREDIDQATSVINARYLLGNLIDQESFYPNSINIKIILEEYFAYLKREYILPKGLIPNSVVITIPFYYDLNTRNILRNVLAEVFNSQELSIIPYPLAIISGYMMHNLLSFEGDIILISETTAPLIDCAYISITPSSIILEKQFQCSWDDLIPQLLLSGLHSSNDWVLDLIFFFGHNTATLQDIFSSAVNKINIMTIQTQDSLALNGTSLWMGNKITAINKSVDIIYPYEFYIEKYIPSNKNSIITKIPFDTANLALTLNSKYSLHTLLDSSNEKEAAVRFRIYEKPAREQEISRQETVKHFLVLDIEACNILKPTVIYLDMNSYSIYPDLNDADHSFENILSNKLFYGINETNKSSAIFMDNILLKLNKLFQIWNGKD